MGETSRSEQNPQGQDYGTEPDAFDEPVFAAEEQEPEFEEPTFEAVDLEEFSPEEIESEEIDRNEEEGRQTQAADVPSQQAVQMPAEPQDSAEYSWFDEEEPSDVASERSSTRRLGRTGPFWLIGTVLALVVIVALWLGLRGDGTGDAVETPAVAGISGSTAMPTAEAQEPTATPEPPTPTPIPILTPGQRVVVGNTDGDGIRLRNTPGLDGLTLDIYYDGDPFQVVDPGSEFASYPVEMDGYRWYRIRVVDDPNDQLVGWAAGDFLIPTGE